jgi:SAM-dependent methyltransferase
MEPEQNPCVLPPDGARVDVPYGLRRTAGTMVDCVSTDQLRWAGVLTVQLPGPSFEGAEPEIYDRCLGPVLFTPYAENLVRRVIGQAGNAVLETACGTGVLTRELRARLPPEVRLVATDLSRAMMDCARGCLGNPGQICWNRADCAFLPFATASFSAMACQFGVMFVADKQAAMREARRVLVDGGLLAFNVWGSLSDNPYARAAQETTARMVSAEPAHFFDVAYGCGDVDAWRSLLAAHNFEVKELEWTRMQLYSPTAEHLALGLTRGTPVHKAIEVVRGEPARVVEEVARVLARLGGAAPFRSTMQALVVTALAT